MDFPLITVGQVPFAAANLEDTASLAIQNAAQGVGQNLRFANAYCVGLASRNEAYKAVLASSGTNFADGWPVALLIRNRMGRKGPFGSYRVRGPSFFEEVIDKGRNAELVHCMVGSTEETLELLESWMQSSYPNAKLAGTYSPPFAPVSDELISEISRRIEVWKPHIIWVGLGTPKQDIVASELSLRHPNLTIASVGAAFDFKAGVVSEAPSWVQRFGMEWIYRFASEPRRLWKRYTIGNLQFLAAILAERSDPKKHPSSID